jgi:hypothetical protein
LSAFAEELATPQTPATLAGQPVAPGASPLPLALSPTLCPVCGDRASEPAAVTKDFDFATSPDTFLVLKCVGCGSIYLSLVPTDEEAARIYPAVYLEQRPGRWRGSPEEGARILDLGVPVRRSRLEEVARGGEQYDLARLDLTLEHIPDPAATLEAVRFALRPGARAVLILNNLRSPAFSLFGGRHWGGYDAPRQRRVLTVDGLLRLAEGAGLELTGLSTVASANPWRQSMRRLCQDWGAPAWLARRFDNRARASTALFGGLDSLFRLLGRGALLVATLRRPARRSTQ